MPYCHFLSDIFIAPVRVTERKYSDMNQGEDHRDLAETGNGVGVLISANVFSRIIYNGFFFAISKLRQIYSEIIPILRLVIPNPNNIKAIMEANPSILNP